MSSNLGSMEEVMKVFNRFDANGDGKISSADLANVLGALGTDTSPEELKQMIEEMDKDGDGLIDFKEFSDFYHRNINGGGGDLSNEIGMMRELRDAFEVYDKDKNGLISATELHMVLKGLGENCTVHDCSRMISSVDLDGDGHVDFDEFKKMMTRTTDINSFCPSSSSYSSSSR